MQKILLIASILLISHFAHAQTKFQKGLYKYYDNIDQKKPSHALDFPIESKTKIMGTASANGFVGSKDGEGTYYRLKAKKKQAYRIGVIIGFSDGENLYVSSEPVTIASKKSWFSPVERINDSIYIFNHFQDEISLQNSYDVISGGHGLVPTGMRKESRYVLNTKGDINELTVEYLSELLESDEELSMKFEKERRKEGLLLLYLIKLLDDGQNE